MYCIHCGADNLESAKFCRKCGLSVNGEKDAEIETVVASRNRDNSESNAIVEQEERKIFSVTPTLKFVKAGYVLAAIGALLLVAIFSVFALVSPWVAVLIGLLLFLVPAFYHLKQKLVRYTLTETSLEIDSGLIARTTRNVPLRRIQDVTVSSNVFQRMLGFGDLVVDNASDDKGGKIVLANINDPRGHAEILMKQMSRLES